MSISWVSSQEIPPEVDQLIRSSGINQNDVKRLLQEQNLDVVIPEANKQEIDNNKFFDSPDEIKQLIDSEISVNDIENEVKDEIEENNDENKNTINEELNTAERQDIDNLSSHFGYSAFFNDPEIFQKSSDLSIPPSYIIGPGDEIILMLWGDTEDVSDYVVSRDGYIFIPNIGRVFVNGLDLAGLEKKLKKILQKAYSSISKNDSNSSTFFDVSLGSVILKPIRVFVMGEVSEPGVYEMKPSSSLFTSLYYFNGPTIAGTLRDVQLIRNGKKIGSIDFYDFLLTGKMNNDIQLQNNDVVFIPPRQKTVAVNGEVRRQSIFELKHNESFKDLENIFGGYLSTTYTKRIRLDRTIPRERRVFFDAQYEIIDLDFESINDTSRDFQLLDGDVFTFFKIGNKSDKIVSISGPVKRPGEYSIGEMLTISGLIGKADGLLNNDIYRDRIDLISTDIYGEATFTSINLDSIYNKPTKYDLSLKTGDNVILYSMSEMVFSENVTIEGYVLNPGDKPYRKGMTVFDLLFLGGGFENTERINNTYMQRADLIRRDGNSDEFELISFNLDSVLVGEGIAYEKLKMGDKIIVFSKDNILGQVPQTVQISGYIKNPGTYDLIKNMYLTDLIFLGSGLNDSTFSKDIIFDRVDLVRTSFVNGKRILYKIDANELISENINNYLLQPGDQVYVYSKNLFDDVDKSVTINGFVNNPGTYQFHDNMVLGDLILQSGGISNRARNIKAEISRISKDEKNAQVFSLEFLGNFETFFDNKNSSVNFALKNKDLINIYVQDLEEHQSVEILGQVEFPGEYVLDGKGDDLSSIIKRAGGITKNANPTSVKVNRSDKEIFINLKKAIRFKGSKHNLPLMNDDVIEVSRRTNTVSIVGAVNTPGTYQFIPGFNVKDYIKMAGGYSKEADKYSTYVRHANGSSEKIRILNSRIKVFDSSTIEVLSKAEVIPFSFTDYALKVTNIYTDLIQAIALISILGNQN